MVAHLRSTGMRRARATSKPVAVRKRIVERAGWEHELEVVAGARYDDRRAELESLRFLGPTWATAPAFPGLGAELFAACTALGLEGLVAKKPGSRYRPGQRSPAWIKAKTTDWKVAHAARRHE